MINTKVNPITVILALIFFYPLFKGFLFKFSSIDLKTDIDEVNRSVSFIISLFLGVFYGKKIFLQHETGIYKDIYNLIPAEAIQYIENNTFIVYLVLIPIVVLICYKLIKLTFDLLNYITFYPLLDSVEKFLSSKHNIFKRLTGLIFQIPKATCYVILAVFLLNMMSMFWVNNQINQYLEGSKPYNTLCREIVIPVTNSNLAKKLPNVINNSFRIVKKEGEPIENISGKTANHGKTIVYYNGVTLEEGIKSNSQIDKTAKNLVLKESNIKSKAKILYNWIGNNIAYDHDKATKVLNNEFNVESGAVSTFNTSKGICFDYSCLYVAMCRANNIKVRLVTGEGFNGVSWVSHAWNQVYIAEENKWINVDTTFYKGGNYFNSKRFEMDHRGDQVAGEW